MHWRVEPFEFPGARRLLLPTEMAAVDAHAIEAVGVPALALMENAARHVARVGAERLAPGAAVWILCGVGNNGVDGLAAARHLAAWGFGVTVVLGAPPARLGPAGQVHLAVAKNIGVSIIESTELQVLPEDQSPALVVDALLGTGLSGPPRGAVARLIEALAAVPAPVLAVDIPSGLCGATGQALGVAVRATETVTFGANKLGHWLHPGPTHVGALRVVDIGLPPGAFAPVAARRWILGAAELALAFGPLADERHKGQAGRVRVVAGSPGRTGAARLAAEAALRAGAGLVTVGTTAAAFAGLAPVLWEVMAEALLPDGPPAPGSEVGPGGAAAPEVDGLAVARLVAALEAADAGVVGPGLPTAPWLGALLAAALPQVRRPLVLDAEALNHLADDLPRLGRGGPRVLTPHPGEAARLLGVSTAAVQADRPGALAELVRQTGAVVVLKGAHTLVQAPDGRLGLCPDGNPGMATAGMGDALAGVIAALLARGLGAFEAAAAGVVWHARAGDLAAQGTSTDAAAFGPGAHGLRARDLIDALGAVERGRWR